MSLEDILLEIIFFLAVFLVVFLVYYYVLCFDRKKKKKIAKVTSMDLYVIKKFNLDETKVNIKRLNFHESIINAFIISFVSVTLDVTSFHIGIKFAIAFALLFGLIYSIYEIYGRQLKKRIGKEDKNA